MSRTLLSLAGFQVIITGRFWVIAEAERLKGHSSANPYCFRVVGNSETLDPYRNCPERTACINLQELVVGQFR